MNKTLLVTLSISLLSATHFCAKAQVDVTYGGINPPEMPALAGSEYLAKVNDNKLFTGSSTQNSLTLLTFNENTPENPFGLIQNWIGDVNGHALGSIKDLHYDANSNLLYVVQQNPSKLVVFDFNSGTNSLSFQAETELNGMLAPERFAITDDLIMIVDMENGTASDLSYDGQNAPIVLGTHDLGTCGVIGQYKDVEVSPNSDYMYVTCFAPANLIKFSLTPTGMTCEGAIDLNTLIGSSLAGDLTFISEDRAYVTSCIGMSGIVRMDSNGDMVDPVPSSNGLFDAMRSVYLPADSLFLIQSAGGSGGTFKVNSDYTLTQLGVSQHSNTFNNELITMAGETIVRSENSNGSLGLMVRENGIFVDYSRTFAVGVANPFHTLNTGHLDIDLTAGQLHTIGFSGITTFDINAYGQPEELGFFPSSDFSTLDKMVSLGDNHVLVISPVDQMARIAHLNWTSMLPEITDSLSISEVVFAEGWEIHHDNVGNTVLISSPSGNKIYNLKMIAGNSIGSLVEIPLGSLSAMTSIVADIAASSNEAVVVTANVCDHTMFELTRTGQDWTVANITNLNSVGNNQCPVSEISFLDSGDRLALFTNSGIYDLDLTAQNPVVNYYQFTGIDGVQHVYETYYNADHQVMFMTHGDTFFENQVRVMPMSSQNNYAGGLVENFDNSAPIHGLVNLSGMVSNGENVVYVIDPTVGLIHTFGIEDFLVGTQALSENRATIYPNPTTGSFNIQFTETFSGTIELIDNVGRIVNSITSSGSNLVGFDSDFRTGMYHVRCIDESGDVFTQRLVKQD